MASNIRNGISNSPTLNTPNLISGSSSHTRILGGLQAVGGLFEAAGGFLATRTKIGQFIGGPMLADGLDNMGTGIRTARTGIPQKTTFVESVAPILGLSESIAQKIEFGIALSDAIANVPTVGSMLLKSGPTFFKNMIQSASDSVKTIGTWLRSSETEIASSEAFQLNRFHQAAKNLSEEAQQNIRILRNWARSKGWIQEANSLGKPERWGTYENGNFTWRLRIKPESSMREGLDLGSNIPRFDARLDPGGSKYINPFNGKIGGEEIGTHVNLENPYHGLQNILSEQIENKTSLNRRPSW